MIPVDEALALVLDNIDPLPAETIDFAEACGRLLREDVASDIDMPPFPRSAVDGFALRAEDLAVLPARLSVVGEVPAGTLPDFRVGVREAAQIMTGAPVPEGADAVQMVEQSRWVDSDVEILAPVTSRQNVAPKGSEVQKGDIVLRRGTRLDPPAVAVAATVGKTRLEVGPRPKVAVIATGTSSWLRPKYRGLDKFATATVFLSSRNVGLPVPRSAISASRVTMKRHSKH